jgi:hypothetical protein
MADEDDVAEVLVAEHAEHVGDMGLEVDQRREQVARSPTR